MMLPIGDALAGLDVEQLSDGDTPIEAICLVKYMTVEGTEGWAMRQTHGISALELIGSLHMLITHYTTAFEGGWQPDTEDDG